MKFIRNIFLTEKREIFNFEALGFLFSYFSATFFCNYPYRNQDIIYKKIEIHNQCFLHYNKIDQFVHPLLLWNN